MVYELISPEAGPPPIIKFRLHETRFIMWDFVYIRFAENKVFKNGCKLQKAHLG